MWKTRLCSAVKQASKSWTGGERDRGEKWRTKIKQTTIKHNLSPDDLHLFMRWRWVLSSQVAYCLEKQTECCWTSWKAGILGQKPGQIFDCSPSQMYKYFSCCCLSRANVSVWASCSDAIRSISFVHFRFKHHAFMLQSALRHDYEDITLPQ